MSIFVDNGDGTAGFDPRFVELIERIHAEGGRMGVAVALGYCDARTMVDLLQTHGYPLDLCVADVIRRGLKVDWGGLRFELERIGKNPKSIDSMLRESMLAAGIDPKTHKAVQP